MLTCQCLEGCSFLNGKMLGITETTDLYREEFCYGDNSNCARFIVFKAFGKQGVPEDLYPFQIKKANWIISERS